MSDNLEEILKAIGDKSPLVGPDIEPENPEDPDSDPKQKEPKEIKKVEIDTSNNEEESLADQYTENFRKSIELFGDVSGDVLKGIKQDRDQTQEVIDFLFTELKSGQKVSPVFVESLVNAMRNKSDINLTAIKAMDSMIKFIQAGKGNDALANINMNIDVAEITRLLSQPKYEDEE